MSPSPTDRHRWTPRPDTAELVVPAPRAADGCWAGAPSVARDAEGAFVLAYRVRDIERGVARIELARSVDGVEIIRVATIERDRFDASSMERPALVWLDDGRWRLYLSLASPAWPASKQWWIDLLEAGTLEALVDAEPVTIFPGDRSTGVKDPVIRRKAGGWEAWICCHPLDERGEEDRMTTAYATSDDGIAWRWHGDALRGRPGSWDARGARLTCVFPDGTATYDGRASKEENFRERTGIARADGDGRFAATGDEPIADVRYLDAMSLDDGSIRLWYEAPLPDGSHEIRSELRFP